MGVLSKPAVTLPIRVTPPQSVVLSITWRRGMVVVSVYVCVCECVCMCV